MGRAYSVRKESIEKRGAVKAKLYSICAKEVYIAAKKGTDPETNERLKRLIEKAKREQIPSDIIKRAIDKAKGNQDVDYQEVTYEGFGPGASSFIINCLTDNVNRTVGYIRAAFNKLSKTLGVKGSVSHNYDYLGIISFKHVNEEEIFEYLLDSGIDIIDIESEDGEVSIIASPSLIYDVKDALKEKFGEIEYTYDEIGMFAKEKITLNGEDKENFEKLLALLNDIEDVNNVYHNVRMD